MTKKISKFIVLTIILLFALTVPVFAREVTVNVLESQINDLETKYNKKIDSFYIIGNYVFTSAYKLDTRDIMLAARSIQMKDNKEYSSGENKDTFLSQMTIHEIERTFNEKYQPTGWHVKDNFIGDTTITNTTKLNIRFIDYNYLKDLYTVTFDLNGGQFAESKPSITVEEGENINKDLITGANAPTQIGKQFKEWVKVENGVEGTAWNFETDTVNRNVTLKATWYDEVDTDKLLEDAQKKIQKNDFYGVIFDKETKTVTFNVYDLNKKNKEIESTGLLADIVNIVKEENVVSITISNGKEEGTVVFDADDVSDGAGPDSAAWQQFGELLTKLTQKSSFDEVTLGDLVVIQDELTLTITLDGTKAHSQNNKETEEYKVEFSYNAEATIKVVSKDEDFSDFNYTLQNTYEIEGKDGLYNVKGYVTQQDGITGFGENPTGFYFAYTITLNGGVDVNKAKVKIPTDDTGINYNEATFDTTTKTVTVLMEVEENENVKYRDIIVEVDGVPTKITIDFSKLELRKSSKFEVKDASNDAAKLQNAYGWTKPNDYGVTITTEGDVIKVIGLLPKHDNNFGGKIPFADEDKTGYYLALVINTTEQKQDTTTVKFINGYKEDGEKTVLGTAFDDNNHLYILKHLHLTDESRTFQIVVDIDGDGKAYTPYTLTVDWNGLDLQERSGMTNIELVDSTEDEGKLTQIDKTTLSTWGYDFQNVGKIDIEKGNESIAYKLKGDIKEQKINANAAGFSTEKGYYVVLKIYGPNEETVATYPHLEKNKWIVQLKNESGTYMDAVTPTQDDYNNGFIVALIKLKDQDNKQLTYKIDWDGNGDYFLPYEEIIDYSGLQFLALHEVSVEGKKEKLKVWDGDTLANVEIPAAEPKDSYHEFAYWNKEDGTKVENITIDKNTGDINLVPHWNLNSDKFIADVIADLRSSDTTHSQDFTSKFDLVVDKGDNSKITIDVKNPETLLSEMNSTSIPGTIAYVLNKEEIQEISLQVVDDTKDYTTTFNKDGVKQPAPVSMANEVSPEVSVLKEKVQAGAKALFKQVLSDSSKNEEKMTLSEMATGENPSFKIKIGSTDETVTLVGNGKAPIKEYTFTFKSDVVTVRDENTLKEALQNPQVKKIFIGGSFSVTNSVEIANSGVIITGGSDYTITAESSSVFTVKSGNATINNLKLASTNNEGIIVKDGATLTTTELNVTECKAAGITVEAGGTLIGEKFIRENEKYDNPLVRAEKPEGSKKGTVNVKDSEGKEATATTVETVIKYSGDGSKPEGTFEIGDVKKEKPDYDYVHYYNKSDIARRWIKISYSGDRAITHIPMRFIRYYDKEGTQTKDDIEPPDNINYLTTYSNSLATFTIANWMNGTTKYAKGSVPAPSSDTYYGAELTAKYNETTKEVTSETELIEAVKAESTYDVVIVKQEITLNNVLDIQKEGLMITGAEAGTTTIKGTIKGQIKVSANKVTFDHINIIGTKVDNKEQPYNVVTINGDNFYSNGVKYSAESLDEGNKSWNSILHYNGEDPTTIVYFGNFKGTNVEKMIEFVNEIDGNTRIIGNNFEGANETKEFILIDKLKEGAVVEIRQQTATFVGENEYGIRIKAPQSKTNATISLGEFWKRNTKDDILKIAIDITETEYDASGYTFTAGAVFKGKIKLEYISADGSIKDSNPFGDNYNAKLEIGGELVTP